MRLLPALALALAPLAAPAPVMAQDRVLTIFGDDKCPSDTICVVAPESERYRIPKGFREPLNSPNAKSWSVRSQATLAEGKTGTGSCSAVGSGGWTGCWAEYMRQMREDAKQPDVVTVPEE